MRFRKFREEVPASVRSSLIAETRRWIMRELRPRAATPEAFSPAIRTSLAGLLDTLQSPEIESWTDEQWESCVLNVLWRASLYGAMSLRPVRPHAAPAVRPRDLLLDATGVDSDLLVNEVLIPFCAAYCDQGFANVPLISREDGFFEAFLALYGRDVGPVPRWLKDVCQELQRLRTVHSSPLESIQESLDLLGIEDDETDAFLLATFASLRGWTGMIWQAESLPGLTVRRLPEGSLVGFTAVRLLLERSAIKHVAREHLDYRGHWPASGMSIAMPAHGLIQRVSSNVPSRSSRLPSAWDGRRKN